MQQQPGPRVTLRTGPDSLVVTGDEAAVLRIDFNPPAGDVSVNWHVILSDSIRGSHRSIQGSGPPPQELVIPRSWLDPRSQRYDVRMDLNYGQQGEFILDRYFWTIITRSRIYWTVILDQS